MPSAVRPLAFVVLCSACAPQPSDPGAWEAPGDPAPEASVAPPDGDLPAPIPNGPEVLTVGELAHGGAATLSVTGAARGSQVFFVASTSGLGAGPCHPRLGVCLDVLGPPTPLGQAAASASGVASIQVSVPAGAPIGTMVHVQAVVADGTATTTNVVSAPVVAAQAPGSGIGVFDNGTWLLANNDAFPSVDTNVAFGAATSVPVAGDWDGGGGDTIGVFSPSTGEWLLSLSNGNPAADIAVAFGNGAMLPVVGDWDGDGDDTLGLYVPAGGEWLLSDSNTSPVVAVDVFFGNASMIPVAGDWNGDGVDTIGLFVPSTGEWLLSNSNTAPSADIVVTFGNGAMSPVVGDWNDDGVDTIGLFVDGTGEWLLSNSNVAPNVDVNVFFGSASSVPVAGDWDAL